MSLDMYPSEKIAIKKAIVEETKRLRNNFLNINALNEFRDRLTDKIHKIGFMAVISTDITDPSNYELADEVSEQLIFTPKVDILSRVEEKAIDFDRMQHEMQAGLDGKGAYKVMPDGTKKEV